MTYFIAAERVSTTDGVGEKKCEVELVDVSRRYRPKWREHCKNQLGSSIPDHVLRRTLRNLSTRTSNVSCNDECDRRDVVQFDGGHHTKHMPTTLQGFRDHPLYCIEGQLGKRKIIRESEKKEARVGIFKGSDVYLRSYARSLYSVDTWFRRHLRTVRESELMFPMRQLTRKKTQVFGASTSDGSKNISITRLYGQWQTVLWQPPLAKNGKVPKNSYGNVETWTEHHLPIGTRHVRSVHALEVAKTLGIDFGRAVVGFETKEGCRYPVFDGIVVCVEFHDVIDDACRARDLQVEEQRKLRRRARIHGRWAHLTEGLLVRAFVHSQFEST